MDNGALVNFDIDRGEKIIQALDRDGKEPKVALWAKLPEYEDWRLVIASDRIGQTGSLYPYGQINDAMEKAGISVSKRPKVFLRPMDLPFIKELRSVFSTSDDTYGMRLGGQKFGDQYIEDAFVYRIR